MEGLVDLLVPAVGTSVASPSVIGQMRIALAWLHMLGNVHVGGNRW